MKEEGSFTFYFYGSMPGNPFAPGDRVRLKQSFYFGLEKLKVKQGGVGTVEEIKDDGLLVRVCFDTLETQKEGNDHWVTERNISIVLIDYFLEPA